MADDWISVRGAEDPCTLLQIDSAVLHRCRTTVWASLTDSGWYGNISGEKVNQKESLDGDCHTGAGRVLTGSQQSTVCGKNAEVKLSLEVCSIFLQSECENYHNIKTISLLFMVFDILITVGGFKWHNEVKEI